MNLSADLQRCLSDQSYLLGAAALAIALWLPSTAVGLVVRWYDSRKGHPGARWYWYALMPAPACVTLASSYYFALASHTHNPLTDSMDTACFTGDGHEGYGDLAIALWPLSIYLLYHTVLSTMSSKIQRNISVLLAACAAFGLLTQWTAISSIRSLVIGLNLAFIADAVIIWIDSLRKTSMQARLGQPSSHISGAIAPERSDHRSHANISAATVSDGISDSIYPVGCHLRDPIDQQPQHRIKFFPSREDLLRASRATSRTSVMWGILSAASIFYILGISTREKHEAIWYFNNAPALQAFSITFIGSWLAAAIEVLLKAHRLGDKARTIGAAIRCLFIVAVAYASAHAYVHMLEDFKPIYAKIGPATCLPDATTCSADGRSPVLVDPGPTTVSWLLLGLGFFAPIVVTLVAGSECNSRPAASEN